MNTVRTESTPPMLLTLTALPLLPEDKMHMCTTLAEAQRHAAENDQRFMYFYPRNGCYYVARKDVDNA